MKLSKDLRVAALYDIHGNLPALEAVLRDIEHVGADCLLVGGDIVTGPMPSQSLERLLAVPVPVHFIRGNAEREVVAAFDGLGIADIPPSVWETTWWTAQQLDLTQRDFLAALPEKVILNIVGMGDVLFCHGSPRSDEEMITPATPPARLLSMLTGVTQAVVVCGHTHMQFDRLVGDKRVINAGSVGMPYGEPGAYWALLGPEVQLMRTEYDLTDAADRIRATTYPQADDFAQNNVLQVPTQAEAIAAFEPAADTTSAAAPLAGPS